MKKQILSLVFLLSLAPILQVKSQTDFRVHAVFIYNFTRMVAWPSEYRTGDFIIAVYGNSPITRELTEMARTRKVGTQSIQVVNFTSLTEITKCHVIYIPATQTRNIEAIVGELRNRNINALIVADARDALQRGAVVNFIVFDGNRQRFELSSANANRMGLTLGADIERFAVLSE